MVGHEACGGGAVSASVPVALGLSGPDTLAILDGLRGLEPFASEPPARLKLEGRDVPVGGGWFEALRGCASGAGSAFWPPDDGRYLIHRPGLIVQATPHLSLSVEAPADLVGPMPFRFLSAKTLHPGWGAAGYRAPSFAGRHFPHGWACAFKGAGHDRLVSRRWLGHGPWRLVHGPGDLSVVQFHDVGAGAAEALAQARPGHRRMGISWEGGFLQHDFAYAHDLRGSYDARERALTVVVLGRDVPAGELLEARAALRDQALGEGRPLDRLRYMFLDPAEAGRHLREVWLHGLECWTVRDGAEARLDLGYAATTPPPTWVPLADARDGEGGGGR